MGFFGAIGNAISGAAKSVSNAVSDVAEAVTDTVSDAAGGLGDMLEDLDWGDISDAFNSVMDGSWSEKLADKLGLPEWVGDVVGIASNPMNVLDLGVNIAEACGADELAGYLETAEKYGEIGLKIASTVAMTAMTGGVGGAIIGAQAASTLSTAMNAINAVRAGLGAMEALENGDWKGAVLSGLGAASGFGEAAGLAQSTMEVINTVSEHSETILNILEDGKIDAEDFKHLASSKIVKDLGIDLPPEVTTYGTAIFNALKDGKLDASDLQHLPLEDLAERTGLKDLANTPHGKMVVDFLKGPAAKALADGKLDASDLQHLPVAQMLEKAGIPISDDLKEYGGMLADALKDGKLDAEDLKRLPLDAIAEQLGLNDLYNQLPEDLVDAVKSLVTGSPTEEVMAKLAEAAMEQASKQELGKGFFEALKKAADSLEQAQDLSKDVESTLEDLVLRFPGVVPQNMIDMVNDLKQDPMLEAIENSGIFKGIRSDIMQSRLLDRIIDLIDSDAGRRCGTMRKAFRANQESAFNWKRFPDQMEDVTSCFGQLQFNKNSAFDLLGQNLGGYRIQG